MLNKRACSPSISENFIMPTWWGDCRNMQENPTILFLWYKSIFCTNFSSMFSTNLQIFQRKWISVITLTFSITLTCLINEHARLAFQKILSYLHDEEIAKICKKTHDFHFSGKRQFIRGENRWDLSPNIFVSCHFDFSWFGNSGIIINKFKSPFQTSPRKIVKHHLPYFVNNFDFSWFDHSGIIIIKNLYPPFKPHFIKFSSIIIHINALSFYRSQNVLG